jgi:DNA ligase (NAD+)
MNAALKDVEALTSEDAATELDRLAREIAKHDAAYYEKDAPKISDAAYDALRARNAAIEARFPELKRKDSPSDRVGAKPSEQFGEVVHAVPMLSLGNAFEDQDVRDFADRIRRFLNLKDEPLVLTAEPKIDGLSANLRYEKGELVLGATPAATAVRRERHGQSQDHFRHSPSSGRRCAGRAGSARRGLYEPCRFRGAQPCRRERGKPEYKNPRNAAAGSLRQIDPSMSPPSGPLQFFAYAWGELSEPLAETQYDAVQRLGRWALSINDDMVRCEAWKRGAGGLPRAGRERRADARL